jgi:hypothetical protein
MNRNLVLAALLSAFAASAAFAQTSAASAPQVTPAGTVQRDVNQQRRIENGLQSGAITTKEAAKLERDESKVDKMQAQALKDGSLSDAEKARLRRAQNRTSKAIAADAHNGATANPNTASSRRMQADVQRNINQEQRIEQGVQSGSLTNRETARLEGGQAHVDRREAVAAADGHVGAREQHRVQRSENHQSRKIRRQKHDAQTQG